MSELTSWCNHGRRWDWHPWDEGSCPTDAVEHGGVVPVTPILSAAIDEIFRLRTQLAFVAGQLSHAADKVRGNAQATNLRVYAAQAQRAAAGEPVWPSQLGSDAAVRLYRKDAGMPNTLTRAQWEQETFGTP